MTPNHLLTVAAGALLVTSTAWAANAAHATNATDEQITERVRSVLSKKDPEIAQRVRIATEDGVVTLSGNALAQGYVMNLLRDTSRVEGVVKVENHLTID